MWHKVQLFRLEMKKILSWKLLLLIGIVNALLFQLRLEFDLDYFPNGRPATDLFLIEQEIIPKYGATLDESEFQDLKATYGERVKAADAYFAKQKQAQELGITDYQTFRNQSNTNPNMSGYHLELLYDNVQNLLWELQAWEYLIENHENEKLSLEANIETTAGARQQHFKEQQTGEPPDFYSSTVLDNFYTYKTNMAVIILISIALLMSPVFLRDYRAGLVPIQYASKLGRKVYRAKWQAGLCSAALLSAVLLTIYMGLYWTNGTATHFNLPLTSFGWYDYWYDLTFVQYIFLSVAAIFFVAMLLAILSMAVSTIVPNAIILIGIQIVVLFIMIAGVVMYLIRDILNIWLPQALVPTGYSVLVLGTIVSAWLIWKREMRKDIA